VVVKKHSACENEDNSAETQRNWPQEIISDLWLKNVDLTNKALDVRLDKSLTKLTVEGMKTFIAQKIGSVFLIGKNYGRNHGLNISDEELIHLMEVNLKNSFSSSPANKRWWFNSY